MIKAIITSLALLFAANTAFAEQYVVFGCKYKEGKGPADLQKWFETFAKPAFVADGLTFEVSVLTPVVSSNPDTPDFYWVERWPDLATYGKQAGMYFDPGAKRNNIVAEAYKMFDCTNAIYAGTVFYKGK